MPTPLPHDYPWPNGLSNRRRVRCANCRASLPAGAAIAWSWRGLLDHPNRYYCPACSAKRQAIFQALIDLKPWLARINAHIPDFWLQNAVKDRLERLAIRCPPVAIPVALRFCRRLQAVRKPEYSSIMECLHNEVKNANAL